MVCSGNTLVFTVCMRAPAHVCVSHKCQNLVSCTDIVLYNILSFTVDPFSHLTHLPESVQESSSTTSDFLRLQKSPEERHVHSAHRI